MRKGHGSVYQRPDGLWAFAISSTGPDGKRRRKVLSSKDEAKIRAAAEAHIASLPPKKTRAERMADSRALGTRTPDERAAVRRAAPKECRYCDTSLNMFNEETDHIIPVGVGSDAADNTQIICWECNNAKRDRLDYEYTGPRPRPFRVHPFRRDEYESFLAAREKFLAGLV
jgi:5-methylcytosine-specific restriction endonuclease McrA